MNITTAYKCKDRSICLRKTKPKQRFIESVVQNVMPVFRRWIRNYRSRQQLLSLDRNQLKDIGVSRSEALEEARKPFWKQ